MLEKIDTGADKVIFTKSSTNPRACEPRELQKRFGEISGKMSQVENSLKDAINLAAKAVTKGDLIVVTGSFYLVGEAKRSSRNSPRGSAPDAARPACRASELGPGGRRGDRLGPYARGSTRSPHERRSTTPLHRGPRGLDRRERCRRWDEAVRSAR